jgi:hypothetical protein
MPRHTRTVSCLSGDARNLVYIHYNTKRKKGPQITQIEELPLCGNSLGSFAQSTKLQSKST